MSEQNMADAVSSLAQSMKPTEPAEKKTPQRYIDGLYFSGTAAQVKLDHRILSFIAARHDDKKKSESRIANHVVMSIRDEEFQSSLTRLESKGLIKRKVREWGHRGEWIELSDDLKEAIATGKGEFFGRQSLAQLGLEG
jgi:hypothetical protein